MPGWVSNRVYPCRLSDIGTPIEEGRAASKSPHYKFGYFLSISQQEVSADIIQNSAVRLLV
jgi:hypothetical protein